jgi:hypothetical protein
VLSFCAALDCVPGLEKLDSMTTSDWSGTISESHIEISGLLPKYAGFRGSYLCSSTQSLPFRVESPTCGVASMFTCKAQFTFDGAIQGNTAQGWDVTLSGIEGYRYSIEVATTESRACVTLELLLNGALLDLGDTEQCLTSGCINANYKRDPWGCRPAPTPSDSPTGSVTRSASPPQSRRQSPTESASRSPPESPTPSAAFTARPSASASPVQSASDGLPQTEAAPTGALAPSRSRPPREPIRPAAGDPRRAPRRRGEE